MPQTGNAVCDSCHQLRPKCVKVLVRCRDEGWSRTAACPDRFVFADPQVWCPACRRVNRGKFRVVKGG
jgi:hypothetical protein